MRRRNNRTQQWYPVLATQWNYFGFLRKIIDAWIPPPNILTELGLHIGCTQIFFFFNLAPPKMVLMSKSGIHWGKSYLGLNQRRTEMKRPGSSANTPAAQKLWIHSIAYLNYNLHARVHSTLRNSNTTYLSSIICQTGPRMPQLAAFALTALSWTAFFTLCFLSVSGNPSRPISNATSFWKPVGSS